MILEFAALTMARKRRVKRKLWSDISIVSAMEAVKDGTVSINEAILLHEVPVTTLKDRLSGRVVHGTRPGPKRYIDDEEERAISQDWLRKDKKVSIVISREGCFREEDALCLTCVRWLVEKLLERQPQLALCRGDATAHVRLDCTNKEAIDKYDLIQETLQAHICPTILPKSTTWMRAGCPLILVLRRLSPNKGQKMSVIVFLARKTK